jgi:N-acetylmuramoyl-L-alanine amidase
MRTTLLGCLLSTAALLVARAPLAATIDEIRINATPNYTRLVLDVSAPVTYKLFTLENPHRVVIDVAQSHPKTGFKVAAVPVNDTAIGKIRGAPRGSDYRIVLDMPRRYEPRAQLLGPATSMGDRLVVDLFDAAPAPVSAVPAPPARVASAPRSAATVTRGTYRDFVVAIDAGHGGSDPGAIGVGKVQEKRVALAIAEELDRLFAAAPGYRGVLVRRGDYYLTLRQRTEVARRQRADLFISIHADAFSHPRARGASVYTLSAKGATSETARWLAEKENASDLIGGVGDVSLDDKDAVLAHVLLDLSMDGNRSASIEAGAAVLQSLAGIAPLHSKRVEQAGFVVLKSPDMPSLLVETGYLSNAEEARSLSQKWYQRKSAKAIVDGVTTQVNRNPPPDTIVAWRKTNNAAAKHVIKRGDTLSDIAAQYRVSSARLRQANGLASDMIRVGQVLIIPAG